MHQPDDPEQQIITREIIREVGYVNGRSIDRIVQALIPVAIVALVGAVWVQSINNARLAVTVENSTAQLSKLEMAVDGLSKEVRELRRERRDAG